MKTKLAAVFSLFLVAAAVLLLTAQISNPTAAGITSLTGDGTLITNSGSTGAVTLAVGTALPAKMVIGYAPYASGTVTASIAATTLCSTTNCPAGTYLVTFYLNETGTGCTTVSTGAVKVGFAYVNNQALSVSDVSGIPLHNPGTTGSQNSLTLTTTGQGSAGGSYVVNTNGSAVSGSDAIQISTALTACGTPGSWTGYQLRAYVARMN